MKKNQRTDFEKLLSFLLEGCLDGEEWREIPFTDGKYFISSFGRVLSLCGKEAKVLKTWNWNNYPSVEINQEKKRLKKRVHRLVALSFIDNPQEKPMVHHKNADKTDNRVENLAWATGSENRLAYLEAKKGVLADVSAEPKGNSC